MLCHPYVRQVTMVKKPSISICCEEYLHTNHDYKLKWTVRASDKPYKNHPIIDLFSIVALVDQ